MTNSILWGNLPDEIHDSDDAVPEVTFCCVQGAYAGAGNIDSDPHFADPGHWDDNGTPDDSADDYWVDGNYRLLASSPCIDAGGNAAVTVARDLDSYVRLVDDPGTADTGSGGPPVVDIGAYEFRPGDCAHDGDVDIDDHADFEGCLAGPAGGVPPDCECFDLDGDGRVDLDDFRTFQMTFTGN